MLTVEEEDELKNMFIKYDHDGNGMLDHDELLILFNTLNIRCSNEDAIAFAKLVDIDEDGNVDYDEFMTMIEQIVDQVTGMQSFMEFFKMLDDKGNGYVSIDQIQQLLENNEVGITQNDVKKILDSDCYTPKDLDQISFTCFRQMVSEDGPAE